MSNIPLYTIYHNLIHSSIEKKKKRKDLDAGKDEKEEKGATEDETVGRHH